MKTFNQFIQITKSFNCLQINIAMSFPECSVHRLTENIIYYHNKNVSMHCFQCFRKLEDAVGVILRQEAKDSFIRWNCFLIEKFQQLKFIVEKNGYHALFEIRIDSRNGDPSQMEICDQEINERLLITIQEYAKMLQENVDFISRKRTLRELKFPEFMKDIYMMFVSDISTNLNYLPENLQKSLRNVYPEKQIYFQIKFYFIQKEIADLDIKRKQIIHKVQSDVVVKYNAVKQKNNVNLDFSASKKYISPRNLVLNQKSIEAIPEVDKVEVSTRVETSSFAIEEEDESQKNNKKSTVQEENCQLKQQVENLKKELKDKENSIKMLHSLIGNEEEELSYRQNEVQMLEKQIKKLCKVKQQSYPFLVKELAQAKKQLELHDRRIRELNSLIGNQEEELLYRENEVQILTEQIKKLMKWKEKYQQTQKEKEFLTRQLKLKENSIKQLNNLIGNEEEELVYREGQVETLTEEVKKLMSYKKKYEQLSIQLKENQQKNGIVRNGQQKVDYDEQLMLDVIELEADVAKRNSDIHLLSGLLTEIGKYVPENEREQVRNRLIGLKSVKLIKQ